MSQMVFMLEEPSMREVLQRLVPQLLPSGVEPVFVVHQGKSNLEKSLEVKLKAWRTPGARFVVVRDQDADDCLELKAHLVALCSQAGRPDALVRIACHELEAWFLGDLAAVGLAFDLPALVKLQRKAKYRDPDQLTNAAEELKKLVSGYQKLLGSRAVSAHLNTSTNRSNSFNVFIKGVRRLASEFNPAAGLT